MRKPILALLAGASLLAGCNHMPSYERPAGAVPATLPQGPPYPPAGTVARYTRGSTSTMSPILTPLWSISVRRP